MNKVDKAYKRLKEFHAFSPNFETFESLFFDNLKDEKKAIGVLLEAIYSMLSSEGERYNELLNIVDETTTNLKKWLDESLKR